MDDNRLKKKLNYKPQGRRTIGRPRTSWEDDFREEGTGLIVDVDYMPSNWNILSKRTTKITNIKSANFIEPNFLPRRILLL